MKFLVEFGGGSESLFFDGLDVIDGNGHGCKEVEGDVEHLIGFYVRKGLDGLGDKEKVADGGD